MLDVLVDRRDDIRDVPVIGSLIGGTLADPSSEGLIDVTDPATGRRLARIEDAGPTGVDAAVAAAAAAAGDWRRMAAQQRSTPCAFGA